MLYSIKSRDVLENLNDLISFKNQVKELRSQDKLGKQNIQENIRKAIEAVTDTIKNASEGLTKTLILTFKANKKALLKLGDKLLEILNDRCLLASCFLSLHLKSLIFNILAILN